MTSRGNDNSPSCLIDFRDVTVMRGGRPALNSLDLRIPLGQNVAILGPNGSGKSTLVKTIARECHPVLTSDGTRASILGRERWNIFELRPLMGVVSGDWVELCTKEIPVREAVLSGFFGSTEIWPHNHVSSSMVEKADEVMSLLEISHLAERDMTELSSGESRRVVIGRALVHDPKALILDEPSASLDLRAVDELRRILRRVAQSGVCIVLVTHHLPDIIPEIDRVILMKQGRVFRDGPKQEMLSQPVLAELFGIRVEVVKNDGYYSCFSV